MNIILSLLVVAGLNSFILFVFMLIMKTTLRVGWGKEEFIAAAGLVLLGVVIYASILHIYHIDVGVLSLKQVLLLGAKSQGWALLALMVVLIGLLASACPFL